MLKATTIAAPLGLYDCCGVSDGAACAILTTPEIARALRPDAEVVTIKALEVSVSNGEEAGFNRWDGAHIATAREAGARAYAAAGVADPRSEIQIAEVHDCFSITEAVLMEDLGFSAPGRAIHDVLDGVFDRDGALPVQPDGGLKCFGHPIGASGLRMVYEVYLQLHGRAGERQLAAGRPRPHPQPRRPPAPERVRRVHHRAPRRLTSHFDGPFSIHRRRRIHARTERQDGHRHRRRQRHRPRDRAAAGRRRRDGRRVRHQPERRRRDRQGDRGRRRQARWR